MIQFEQYKLRKKSFSISYKGIDLARCLTFDFYQVDDWTLKRRDLGKLRRAYDFASIRPETKTILATFGLQYRADHHSAFEYVVDQLNEEAAVYNIYDLKLVKHPNWLLVFKMLFMVLAKTCGWGLKFKQRLYLWCQTVLFCNSIDELEKIDLSSIKCYIAMYSSHHLENLITQWMKQHGIVTYGLNEGVLVHYTHNIPIDAVTYENFETDYMLTWGQFTKDEFVKAGVPSDKLIVGGYPHSVKEIIPMSDNNPLKNLVVLLARSSYDAANRSLLTILSLYKQRKPDLEIYLKMHPVSDIEGYTKFAQKHGMQVVSKEKTVNDCLCQDAFDFAIAVNTSAYYESLMKGVPCLRFCDGSFDLMPGCDDVFSEADSFVNKMEWLRNTDIAIYQQEVKEALRYALGYGVNNYKQIGSFYGLNA